MRVTTTGMTQLAIATMPNVVSMIVAQMIGFQRSACFAAYLRTLGPAEANQYLADLA